MSPPETAVSRSAPGVIQARAGGRTVEVRSYEGSLLRKASEAECDALVVAGLAIRGAHFVRLQPTIKVPNMRAIGDSTSRLPDLELMRKRQPVRYAAIWRGGKNNLVGQRAGTGMGVSLAGLPNAATKLRTLELDRPPDLEFLPFFPKKGEEGA